MRGQLLQHGCHGVKRRLYDRVDGQFRPIGWICDVCLKLTLDPDPEYDDKFLIACYTESKRQRIIKNQ